ncbi:NAP-domain-containing protein [Amniculicola lignicola CBS 123094]|uniref:NAP-domain-containing protein n=1 Tax=Amniculicola lignicola CBS 123094 TaxID=1392246 RepID=A0A6A5WK43_9PLEO|nr:NAP-domain-containing protein [Amniculicola lignicola CBS 123094]
MANKDPLTLPEPGRSEYQAEFLQKNPGVGAPVRELLDLQKRHFALDKRFQDEIWQLEQRHYERCQMLFQKRAAITKGSEPGSRSYSQVVAQGAESRVPTSTTRGLPHFWLRAMKNSPEITKWITRRDEPALSYLSDVRVEFLKDGVNGFRLLFDFDENPFFTNQMLTKDFTYETESQDDGIYGESMNSKADGCEIHWKPGRDLTEVAEVAPGKFEFESFFDFFNTTSWKDEEEYSDGEDEQDNGDEYKRHDEEEDDEEDVEEINRQDQTKNEDDDMENGDLALDADFDSLCYPLVHRRGPALRG